MILVPVVVPGLLVQSGRSQLLPSLLGPQLRCLVLLHVLGSNGFEFPSLVPELVQCLYGLS